MKIMLPPGEDSGLFFIAEERSSEKRGRMTL